MAVTKLVELGLRGQTPVEGRGCDRPGHLLAGEQIEQRLRPGHVQTDHRILRHPLSGRRRRLAIACAGIHQKGNAKLNTRTSLIRMPHLRGRNSHRLHGDISCRRFYTRAV